MAVSLSLFNFFIEMLFGIALSLCENSGIDMCSDKNVYDLEYADAVIPLSPKFFLIV